LRSLRFKVGFFVIPRLVFIISPPYRIDSLLVLTIYPWHFQDQLIVLSSQILWSEKVEAALQQMAAAPTPDMAPLQVRPCLLSRSL